MIVYSTALLVREDVLGNEHHLYYQAFYSDGLQQNFAFKKVLRGEGVLVTCYLLSHNFQQRLRTVPLSVSAKILSQSYVDLRDIVREHFTFVQERLH